MAEVDTTMLSREHADIRREVAQGIDALNDAIRVEGGQGRLESAKDTNEIIKESMKGTHEVFAAVRDNRYDISSRIENAADRNERNVAELRNTVADRFFAVGRDISGLYQGQATLSKDIELNSLKSQIEAQKNTQFLSEKITSDGEKTRELINDLKYHDLSRGLVERHASLVHSEHDRDHWRHRYHDGRFDALQAQSAGQWAQMQSQVQAFQSQLQETRQGMVNFGTMAGVGQSSTSNNVR